MTLSPLQLAAIVTAGVPGIYPVAATAAPEETADYDTAVITDSTNRHWRVRAPRHPDASVRLETEHQVVRSFSPALRARLPFAVPTVVGTVPYDGMTVFVYSHVPGTVHDVEELARLSAAAKDGSASLAGTIGRMIATLHVMPEDILIESDMPLYSSQNIRVRKLSELDHAQSTGKVPAELVEHWRTFLQDGPQWDFRTRVIHGRLGAENITLDGETIAEVSGWSEIHVGDPAQDLSWLFSCSDTTFTDNVVQEYSSQMPQVPDDHLIERAEFYAEFAIAQWLTHGVEIGNQKIIDHGTKMLQALHENLREEHDTPDVPQNLPETTDKTE